MRRTAVLLFCVSLAVRLFLLYGLHRHDANPAETTSIARSLVEKGSFADPYLIPTGPTAHAAPLYPAFAALFYTVFGVTQEAERARFAANAVATSVGYALLPAVSDALGIGPGIGIGAGLAGAVVPLHYWPECPNDFENAWTALFLECAVLWFARLLKGPAAGVTSGTGAGLFWGFGLLLAPTVAMVMAAFVGIAIARRRLSRRWGMAFAATIVVVLTPWTIRNYRALGGFVFVRDDFGLELRVSNHDGATPVFERNGALPWWPGMHPHRGMAPALEIRRDGELAFERRNLRAAAAWIAAHPARFLELTAGRVFYFWFPDVPRFRWALWTVTVLAIVGWWRLRQRNRFAAMALGVTGLAYSLPFWAVESTLRYQHPVWWALVLAAACAFDFPQLGVGRVGLPQGAS